MTSPLTNLGLSIPVIAAPMAGGATTPAMVIAAARAGGMGFLGAGYKTPESLRAEISAVRDASIPFGVNVSHPTRFPIPSRATAGTRRGAARGGPVRAQPARPIPSTMTTRSAPRSTCCSSSPVPIVELHLRPPGPERRPGTAEGRHDRRADGHIAAEARGRGGRRGRHARRPGQRRRRAFRHPHPGRPPRAGPPRRVVPQVTAAVPVPVIAAGGLATPEDVADVLQAGAGPRPWAPCCCCADESGASATHQAALQDPARTETTVTRAFTGRPARGLRNASSTPSRRWHRWVIPRSTISPARCARPPPPRANRTSCTCGRAPGTATPVKRRRQRSCPASSADGGGASSAPNALRVSRVRRTRRTSRRACPAD